MAWAKGMEGLLALLAVSSVYLSTGVEAGDLKFCELRLPSSGHVTPDIVYYQTSNVPQTRYAWSMVGYPTLFMSHSNQSLPCGYDQFKYNKTSYENNQQYSSAEIPGSNSKFAFGLALTRVIEFDVNHEKAADAFNTSKLFCDNYTTKSKCYNSSSWLWLNQTHNTSFSNNNTFMLSYNQRLNLQLKIELPKTTGQNRLSYFPKTLFDDESSVFDLTFQFLAKTRDRVAVEMVLVNGHGVGEDGGDIGLLHSVDDEYTPSVFKTLSYMFGNSSDTEGFLVWKPITYMSRSRLSTQSQQANYVYKYTNASFFLPNGLITALFNNTSSVGNLTRFYMVFGTSGDETYVKPTFLTWTAAVGYGQPPKEAISLAVIISISVGLGLPGLLMLTGGVFVVIKKKPWENVMRWTTRLRRRQGYSRVNQ